MLHISANSWEFLAIPEQEFPQLPLHTYLQHGLGVWQLLPLVDFDVCLEKHREKGIMLECSTQEQQATTPTQLQAGFREGCSSTSWIWSENATPWVAWVTH